MSMYQEWFTSTDPNDDSFLYFKNTTTGKIEIKKDLLKKNADRASKTFE
jgi:hypothetical protein